MSSPVGDGASRRRVCGARGCLLVCGDRRSAHDVFPGLRAGPARDRPVPAPVSPRCQRIPARPSTELRFERGLFGDALAARLPARLVDAVVAINSKTTRGARGKDGGRCTCCAAFDARPGRTGPDQVNGRSTSHRVFAPLLDRIDLTNVLMRPRPRMRSAPSAGRADYLPQRGGHYLLIAKPNQPRLHAQLVGLPWHQIPVVDQRRGRGTVGSSPAARSPLSGRASTFPHTRLAIQVVRRRRPLGSTTPSSETVYAITDLSWRHARADLIAEAIRAIGESRISCTGSATSSSARTYPRHAPATDPRSWPPCATSP